MKTHPWVLLPLALVLACSNSGGGEPDGGGGGGTGAGTVEGSVQLFVGRTESTRPGPRQPPLVASVLGARTGRPGRVPALPGLERALGPVPAAALALPRPSAPARPAPPAPVLDGQLIIGLRGELSAGQALKLLATPGLRLRHGGFASRRLHLVHVSDARGAPVAGDNLDALAARWARLPGVRFVEKNRVLTAQAVPNDPLYTNQWHYAALNLPAAWDVTQGSSAVVVAVLDTGSKSHPELDARTVAGIDMITDVTVAGDGDGRDSNPNDEGKDEVNGGSSWHATHVAGTIGAASNNGVGIAGVDWNCRLQHVRVLGRLGGAVFDIAAGIEWASGGTVPGLAANATPAAVLNLSLTGKFSAQQTYQEVIDAANARGAVILVAAGNSNEDASQFSPCNQQGVLCIGATRFSGTRASYSNFGARIDVVAPGGEVREDANGDNVPDGVISTYQDAAGLLPEYKPLEGTSMATPHVAGVVALMKARNPQLNFAQARMQLVGTALASGQCSEGCGAGMVNAQAAVLGVAGQAPPPMPRLAVISTELFFTPSAPKQALQVSNVGGETLTVTLSGSGDALARLGTPQSMLTIAPGQAGSFNVEADFAGVAEGTTLTGALALSSNGGDARVNVALKVPTAGALKPAVVALAFQDETGAWKPGGAALASPPDYAFRIEAAPGRYFVVGLVDVNGNDAYDEGEPSGAYPNEDAPEQVTVEPGGAVTGLRFTVSPPTSLGGGGPRFIGGACAVPSDCGANAQCVTDFPGGYCSASCATAACEPGARCVTAGTQQICLSTCNGPGAGQGACRQSYVCYGDGTGGGVCLPRCATTADCDASETCDVASGYCR